VRKEYHFFALSVLEALLWLDGMQSKFVTCGFFLQNPQVFGEVMRTISCQCKSFGVVLVDVFPFCLCDFIRTSSIKGPLQER
jgi:hypothetical protein